MIEVSCENIFPVVNLTESFIPVLSVMNIKASASACGHLTELHKREEAEIAEAFVDRKWELCKSVRSITLTRSALRIQQSHHYCIMN